MHRSTCHLIKKSTAAAEVFCKLADVYRISVTVQTGGNAQEQSEGTDYVSCEFSLTTALVAAPGHTASIGFIHPELVHTSMQ